VDPGDLDPEAERKLAAGLFNHTWDLLERSGRTAEQDEEMVHAAHASRHHWGRVGAALNLVRGDWLVSRVYAVLGRAEPAAYHASRCLVRCEAAGIGGFDLGYAHEAVARAAAASGDMARCRRHVELGRAAAAGIEDGEDRALLLADLETVPG
jgi:hypothetical protein